MSQCLGKMIVDLREYPFPDHLSLTTSQIAAAFHGGDSPVDKCGVSASIFAVLSHCSALTRSHCQSTLQVRFFGLDLLISSVLTYPLTMLSHYPLCILSFNPAALQCFRPLHTTWNTLFTSCAGYLFS